MRHLQLRLQADARDAGATVEGERRVRGLSRVPGGVCVDVDGERVLARLDPGRLGHLMGAGLVPPSVGEAWLLQGPPRLAARELPRLAVGAARNPGIVIEMVPILNRMASIRRHAKKYLAREDRLAAWVAVRRSLLQR